MAKKNTRTESLEVPITLADHPFYGLKLDEQQKVFRDAIWDKDKLIVLQCQSWNREDLAGYSHSKFAVSIWPV